MTIEISSDESAEKGLLACDEVAKILGTAIGPLLDDLYHSVKRRDETEIEYLFSKIYETVDWQKPDVFEDAAYGVDGRK